MKKISKVFEMIMSIFFVILFIFPTAIIVLIDCIGKRIFLSRQFKKIKNADIIAALTNEEGAVPLQRAIRYTDDPNAPEMRVKPNLPPLRYADLQAKLKEKKPTIKFGKVFYAALKTIKANKNYCQSNYLDPENKSSTKKDFYTHEAVDALLTEYERLEDKL